ncbi:MAG: leucyl/phenylalanyl-tRNA--protein transferase [Chlorobiaceae bacterium]|jgi:leucyl/phenylalanyl-tRNA---protein transferase|nr:leucyl/phenylalanyl-tRNA--protein transferase [Chlorobiaceae bacterium]NTW63273.1 leucyl/phenylalanyl-tRNA--protein transferase [Chlorobiaceae bacterium]
MIRIDELLRAYRQGFFPMADPDDKKVYWCQPYKRAVVPLVSYNPSRDVARMVRKREFEVRINSDFEGVIRGCAAPRKSDCQTWISPEIIQAYLTLNQLGVAHSVECWHNGVLSGGLYGLAMGAAFFGESMFFRRSYASQVAFDHLVMRLKERGYLLLDAQIMNPHLQKLGAVEIDHDEYMLQLDCALGKKIRFI